MGFFLQLLLSSAPCCPVQSSSICFYLICSLKSNFADLVKDTEGTQEPAARDWRELEPKGMTEKKKA